MIPASTGPSDGRASRRVVLYAITLGLLLLAFAADYYSGVEVSSSLFYVVPVGFAAWFIGRGQGLAVAVASTVAWRTALIIVGVAFSKPSILYWNLAAEAMIYGITALAVARVREDRVRERGLTERIIRANESLDREALAVGQLQRKLLPDRMPELAGYSWEIHYATSTRAGGDYYDFVPLRGGRLGVFIGDATGHGAPAAVLMGMAKALLRADGASLELPDRVMERLNGQLAQVLPSGWFLTACYAVLDPGEGRLDYSQAGHESPVVVRAASGATEQLGDCGGLPLGTFAEARYPSGSEVLEPGDTLVLFTDGVTEAMSPERELFGVERLRAALGGTHQVALARMKQRLLASLAEHTRGAPVADDTTFLLLRRSGGPHVEASAAPGSGRSTNEA